MMGTAVSEINDEVEDIVGELTNIVVGGAKIEFAGLGYSFNISLPLLVSGEAHVIKHKHESPVLVIPFTLDDGKEFDMEISVKVK